MLGNRLNQVLEADCNIQRASLYYPSLAMSNKKYNSWLLILCGSKKLSVRNNGCSFQKITRNMLTQPLNHRDV